MPIISPIGRRHPRIRALMGAIYLVLIAGAVTMVYPFLLMLSGSTKSAVDVKSMDVIPRFLRDDLALYRKHVEGLFNESPDAMNIAYDTDFTSFESVVPPATVDRNLVAEWGAFLAGQPPPSYAGTCGYLQANVSRTVPGGLRAFKHELAKAHDDDIESLNGAFGTDFGGWNAFYVLPGNVLSRRAIPPDTPMALALDAFTARQPPGMRYVFSVEGFFKRLYLKTQYTKDIAEYNRAHGTLYRSYDDIHLTRTVPDGTDAEKKDWETFVRSSLNLLWIRAEPGAASAYRDYLRAKYLTVDKLNRAHGTGCAAFDEVPLVDEPPTGGLVLSDWDAFVTGWKDPDTGTLHILPTEFLRVHSIEFEFRDYLAGKTGVDAASLLHVLPPQRDLHYLAFLDMREDLRAEFVTRNFRAVIDYMLLHGRGITNTGIYCALAVLLALIVNPLAAYAMSRYRMPSAYKILLFLMLTMAFPPMVTQIPVFLMLRELGLLNTFAALLLPGLANGYLIFLLKGFFDSQPRDLYECAQLDGAGEWTMFWQITMSLAKPILSVVALNAFVAAYTNFMFALLICQDEKMWTIMVWLYQLQQRSGPSVVYASLVIAAIPTFIVFMFCQRVILRGIVVPVEK
ncbi:MAG: ABC transporter permease subunit [bacterium]